MLKFYRLKHVWSRGPQNCENLLPVKFKIANSVHILNCCNSSADGSISLKFGAEFNHVTADTNIHGQKSKVQGHSVT